MSKMKVSNLEIVGIGVLRKTKARTEKSQKVKKNETAETLKCQKRTVLEQEDIRNGLSKIIKTSGTEQGKNLKCQK